MGLELIPKPFKKRFHVAEHRNACAILAVDCATEFKELLKGLAGFELLRSQVIQPGGNKTVIAMGIEKIFTDRGWGTENTAVELIVNGKSRISRTHAIDLCKGKVACEIQWNSKDGVFSRDLATLRMLHEIEAISAGVIITRGDELQEIFDALGWVRDKNGKPQRVGGKYGESTTHWSKLTNRINNDDAGMCPVLMIGISDACYRDDMPSAPVFLKAKDLPP